MTNDEHNKLKVADSIASMVAQLRYLEKKSKNDDETLALQRKQIEELTIELTNVEHNARFDLGELQRERDDAVRRAEEVQKIIEKIGTDALAGVRAIKGNQTPTVMPQVELNTSLASRDNRLPRIAAQ